jgi:formylglycine-generating enzyme required for sulfatase activity
MKSKLFTIVLRPFRSRCASGTLRSLAFTCGSIFFGKYLGLAVLVCVLGSVTPALAAWDLMLYKYGSEDPHYWLDLADDDARNQQYRDEAEHLGIALKHWMSNYGLPEMDAVREQMAWCYVSYAAQQTELSDQRFWLATALGALETMDDIPEGAYTDIKGRLAAVEKTLAPPETTKAVAPAMPSEPTYDELCRSALRVEYSNPTVAVGFFEQILRRDPERRGIWLQLGRTYLRLGREADADSCFGMGRIGRPPPAGDSAGAWRERAENARDGMAWELAARHYRRALELAPGDSDGWRSLGELYETMKQPDSAQACFARAGSRIYLILENPSQDENGAERARSSTDEADMVRVPAGWFLMGSPAGEGESNEHPLHRVYLDEYWIDRTEVTFERYFRFCEQTDRKKPSLPDYLRPLNCIDAEAHPVVGITHDDAVAYSAWAGKSLPTEAEWEKAARGTDMRTYPWGSAPPESGDYANLWDKVKLEHRLAEADKHAHGQSPYGCLNMAGNAEEMCIDHYDSSYYRVSPDSNPAGPYDPEDHYPTRVCRGGGVEYHSKNVRCAVRASYSTEFGGGQELGFRCVFRPGRMPGRVEPAKRE